MNGSNNSQSSNFQNLCFEAGENTICLSVIPNNFLNQNTDNVLSTQGIANDIRNFLTSPFTSRSNSINISQPNVQPNVQPNIQPNVQQNVQQNMPPTVPPYTQQIGQPYAPPYSDTQWGYTTRTVTNFRL